MLRVMSLVTTDISLAASPMSPSLTSGLHVTSRHQLAGGGGGDCFDAGPSGRGSVSIHHGDRGDRGDSVTLSPELSLIGNSTGSSMHAALWSIGYLSVRPDKE